MKQILISGYYGFDNAGDEAVLAGLVSGLRKTAPKSLLEITGLSIEPSKTEQIHNVAARHRYRDLVPALLKTDLLLSGGGSLLQDVTSAHGIFYYLAVVRMAQILGCKTMFVAQGIGPLTRKRSINLTAKVANRLDAITVRDIASSALLESIGVTRTITVTADPALLLEPSPAAKKEGILLSLRDWDDCPETFETDLAKALIRTGLPRRLQALNMHGESDAEAARRVLDHLQMGDSDHPATSDRLDYRALLNSVAASEMVIGMRLHALIFAAAAGVPVVGLSYDPKVAAFMHQIGQDDAAIDAATASTEQLSAVIGEVWHTRHERAELLRKRLPALRKAAQKNADIALNLLQ